MQYILASPTFITVLALAFMGFIVVRNGRERTNMPFILFILFDSLWLISVWVVLSTTVGLEVFWSRLVFAVAIALVMALHNFTNTLLKIKHSQLYKWTVFGSGTAVALLILLTDTIIRDVKISYQAQQPSPFPEYGIATPLFGLYLLISIGAFLFMLVKYAKSLKTATEMRLAQKRQLASVTIGFVSFVVISLLTNLILPTIFANAGPSQLAPIGSLALAFAFFYAIMRHKLFDIKTTVIRSTTYLFLVAALAFIFVAVVTTTGSLVILLGGGSDLQLFINTIIALALAVSFQPLKHLFDHLTDRVFYRDNYNPQAFIDRLNQVLASNIELKLLLNEAAQTINSNLKTDYCLFGIEKTKFENQRVMGTTGKHFSLQDMTEVMELASHVNRSVIVTDYIATQNHKLRKLLIKNEAAVLVKIAPLASQGVSLGYLILGQKKNGDPFNRQDIQLLEIFSKSLLVATQNALRFEEIHAFNKTLQGKVDEATAQLQKTNDKLRELDQAKDEFIGMASHQLRTPLTSVKGYLSMVLEGDAGKLNDMQLKLVEEAYASSQRMVYLIGDFLNVSRLKTGKFVLERRVIDLAHLVAEEVEQMRSTATSRQLVLVYDEPKKFPLLNLDINKIRQVVMNLIDNAIFYSREGTAITIELIATDKEAMLRVKDTGIGVPKDEQHHLFTKFFRASNARKIRPDGTGIGLFMAKKVIVSHGGALIFESTEGKGSTFGFRLPLKDHWPSTTKNTPKE